MGLAALHEMLAPYLGNGRIRILLHHRATAAEIQAIKADLGALRDDMSSLSKALLKRGVRTARAAREAVEHQIEGAGESVEAMVHERRFAMLALAFSAGAVLGLLLHRR